MFGFGRFLRENCGFGFGFGSDDEWSILRKNIELLKINRS